MLPTITNLIAGQSGKDAIRIQGSDILSSRNDASLLASNDMESARAGSANIARHDSNSVMLSMDALEDTTAEEIKKEFSEFQQALTEAIKQMTDSLKTAKSKDSTQWVKVVHMGANDDYTQAYDKTMDRIMGKHSQPDTFDLPMNDNSDPVGKTMTNIINNYNASSGSPNWMKYREGINDDKQNLWEDGVVPVRPNHDDAHARTIDRIMSLHNSHEREFAPASNDIDPNPIAVSYMSRLSENTLRVPDDEIEADNDNEETKAKRIRRTREQVSNDLLRKIERHTAKTAVGVAKLVDAFDELGIDSLRARERAIESGNGYMAGTGMPNSGMAPEGKTGQEIKPEEGKGFWEGVKGAVAGVGAAAVGIPGVMVAGAAGVAIQGAAKSVGAKDTETAGGGVNNSGGSGSKANSTGIGYLPATKIPTKVANDKEFQSKITSVARKYNIAEDDLYRVIGFESNGTYSPSVKNPNSSATGLIQFMTGKGAWATRNGYTRDSLSKMTRTQQMDVVDKYFGDNQLGKVKNPNVDDLYMSIFNPSAVTKGGDAVLYRRGQAGYGVNTVLDANKDGVITKAEAASVVKDKNIAGMGKYTPPKPLNESQLAQQLTKAPPASTPTMDKNASGIVKEITTIRQNTRDTQTVVEKMGSMVRDIYNGGARDMFTVKERSTTPSYVQRSEIIKKPVTTTTGQKVQQMANNNPTVQKNGNQQTINVGGTVYNVHSAKTGQPNSSARRPAQSKGFWDSLKDYF